MPRELAEGEELNFDTDRNPRTLKGLQRKSEKVRSKVPRNRTSIHFDDSADVRVLLDKCLRNSEEE